LFDYKCPDCEAVAEDVLVHDPDTEIICEDCETTMSKLLGTFAIVMGSSWLKNVENKFGRDGNPYMDEAGNKRPGVDDSYPVVPGPRTKAKWRNATKQINKLKEQGE